MSSWSFARCYIESVDTCSLTHAAAVAVAVVAAATATPVTVVAAVVVGAVVWYDVELVVVV